MTEQKIAEIFEQVGLAKIVRELGNNELLNAVQSAMIEIAGHSEIPNNHEGLDEAAETKYPERWKKYPNDGIVRSEEYYDINAEKRDAYKAGAEWAMKQGRKEK